VSGGECSLNDIAMKAGVSSKVAERCLQEFKFSEYLSISDDLDKLAIKIDNKVNIKNILNIPFINDYISTNACRKMLLKGKEYNTLNRERLSYKEFLVVLFIWITHDSKTGLCTLSFAKIGSVISSDKQTVKRILKKLLILPIYDETPFLLDMVSGQKTHLETFQSVGRVHPFIYSGIKSLIHVSHMKKGRFCLYPINTFLLHGMISKLEFRRVNYEAGFMNEQGVAIVDYYIGVFMSDVLTWLLSDSLVFVRFCEGKINVREFFRVCSFRIHIASLTNWPKIRWFYCLAKHCLSNVAILLISLHRTNRLQDLSVGCRVVVTYDMDDFNLYLLNEQSNDKILLNLLPKIADINIRKLCRY
jgi:hypothetical protein